MRRFLAAISLSFLTAVPAAAVDYKSFVEKTVSDYIQLEFSAFQREAAGLKEAVGALCSAETAENRAAFAATFRQSVTRFARLSFLRFGPMAQEDRLERLAFLLDPRGIGLRQVSKLVAAKDQTTLEVATLADKSVAVQGLTALQFLAFDKNGAVVLGVEADPYKCRYAEAIAANVATIAQELDAGWRNTDVFAGLPPKEAAEDVFNALVTGVTILRDQEVLAALGPSQKKARPQRVPFSRSRNGMAYLKAEVSGIRDALEASAYRSGLAADVEWLADSVGFEFKNALDALEAVPSPIRSTLREDINYGKFKYLVISLGSLREMLSPELAGALEMTGGFNALDGD